VILVTAAAPDLGAGTGRPKANLRDVTGFGPAYPRAPAHWDNIVTKGPPQRIPRSGWATCATAVHTATLLETPTEMMRSRSQTAMNLGWIRREKRCLSGPNCSFSKAWISNTCLLDSWITAKARPPPASASQETALPKPPRAAQCQPPPESQGWKEPSPPGT